MGKETLGDTEDKLMVNHEHASYLENGNNGEFSPTLDCVETGDAEEKGSDLEEPMSKGFLPSSQETEKVLKLSPAKVYDLTSSLNAFPLHVSASSKEDQSPFMTVNKQEQGRRTSNFIVPEFREPLGNRDGNGRKTTSGAIVSPAAQIEPVQRPPMVSPLGQASSVQRPLVSSRTLSTPTLTRSQSSSKLQQKGLYLQSQAQSGKSIPAPLDFDNTKSSSRSQRIEDSVLSPESSSLPLPPLSLPVFLHLELSSEERPSSLYIHRPASSDFPYEPSQIKIERLLNFLLLPPLLEQVLWFGTVACLDAWLYTFTILPLRFLKAISVLGHSWVRNMSNEGKFVAAFVYSGTGRLWKRRGHRRNSIKLEKLDPTGNTKSNIKSSAWSQPDETEIRNPSKFDNINAARSYPDPSRKRSAKASSKHRRAKSIPSELMPSDKADILRGLLIILTCWILMYFDASMMYHSIRGQAAIKLYVIYNVLEVC